MIDKFFERRMQLIYRIARLKCRLLKHKVHTEYRAACDVYGETWCVRCGEYEPEKWLPE